ncbi:hypothetical protein LCGC14_0724490 [marine sediment metagenome]|uniref:Nitrate/nitrite sensing protein domain-containing protein n=1 Tax=marine sediment metagenome TaxID=412755 RepID=A0A0F9QWG6_9ZZZZ|nr:hypothetical protein [Methylophaga sp.]
MDLKIVATVSVSLLLLVIIKYWLSNNKRQAAKIKLGFRLIEHIQKVISCCQQHRGISNAILQGNKSLRTQLISTQLHLDELVAEGNILGLKAFPQWESFIGHWPKLKMHSLERDLTSQNLLRQHNVMVYGHLSLLDELMSEHDLTWIMLGSSIHMSQLCIDTLKVAETIGQSRAIGSGVCSRGECLGIDKISLSFLRISIISPTNELLTELSQVEDPVLLSQLTAASKLIKEAVDKLVATIEDKVLIDGKIELDAADFFKLATQPIDALNGVYKSLVAHSSRATN